EPVPAQTATKPRSKQQSRQSGESASSNSNTNNNNHNSSSGNSAMAEDPEVWEVYTDTQSRTYYYNPRTRESTWQRPASLSARSSWQPVTDPEGRTFFF